MRSKGLFLAFLASSLFGLTVISNKLGLNSSLDSLEFATLAIITGGILSAPFIIKRRKEFYSVSKKSLWLILVIGILASGVASLLLFWGQNLTTATNGGFIASLSSFFTIPFAVILLKEKLSSKKYPFIALLLIGVYLLIVGTKQIAVNIGDLLILITAFLWGSTNALSRIPMKEVKGDLVAYSRLFIGAVVFLPVLFYVLRDGLPVFGWQELLVFSSGFLMWFCIVCLYRAISLIGATTASLILILHPLIATILAIFILGETLTIVKLIGGLAIIIGTSQVVRK